jgi:hypothetical protein
VLFFAMLFAGVDAANQLGLTQVRDVVTVFIHFGGNVLLGSHDPDRRSTPATIEPREVPALAKWG